MGMNLTLYRPKPPHPPLSPAGERVRERGKPGIVAFWKHRVAIYG